MLKLCLGFFGDTSFCVKWLARLSIFIHANILVLVSEFVVVVILSEWWSMPTTVGTSLPMDDHVISTQNFIPQSFCYNRSWRHTVIIHIAETSNNWGEP